MYVYFKIFITWLKNVLIFINCFFLQEPNPEDPLNKEAADELQSNRRLFEQHVQRAMRGGYVGSSYFERCLKWSHTTHCKLTTNPLYININKTISLLRIWINYTVVYFHK